MNDDLLRNTMILELQRELKQCHGVYARQVSDKKRDAAQEVER